MATVEVVIRDPERLSEDKNNHAQQFGKRMLIETTDHKRRFYAPTAPVNIRYYGYGYQWTEVNRAGRMPYLIRESYKLPKISFQLKIYDEFDYNRDFTSGIGQLSFMSATMTPIRIVYGGYFEARLWRMTSFEFESQRRHPSTNAITGATVDLEFTMVQDFVVSAGPVSGGVKK